MSKRFILMVLLFCSPLIIAPSCDDWNNCKCVKWATLNDFELDVKVSSGGCDVRTEKHIIAYFDGHGKSLWSCDSVDGDYHRDLCNGAVVGNVYCVELDPDCCRSRCKK